MWGGGGWISFKLKHCGSLMFLFFRFKESLLSFSLSYQQFCNVYFCEQNSNVCYFSVPEPSGSRGQESKIKVSLVLVPSGGSGRTHVLPLLYCVMAAGNPWHSLACDRITPVSVPTFAWPLSCIFPKSSSPSS